MLKGTQLLFHSLYRPPIKLNETFTESLLHSAVMHLLLNVLIGKIFEVSNSWTWTLSNKNESEGFVLLMQTVVFKIKEFSNTCRHTKIRKIQQVIVMVYEI